jgi:hypothetical protein
MELVIKCCCFVELWNCTPDLTYFSRHSKASCVFKRVYLKLIFPWCKNGRTMKLTTELSLVTWLRMRRALHSAPLYAVMEWGLGTETVVFCFHGVPDRPCLSVVTCSISPVCWYRQSTGRQVHCFYRARLRCLSTCRCQSCNSLQRSRFQTYEYISRWWRMI